jgi:hypothetical protein
LGKLKNDDCVFIYSSYFSTFFDDILGEICDFFQVLHEIYAVKHTFLLTQIKVDNGNPMIYALILRVKYVVKHEIFMLKSIKNVGTIIFCRTFAVKII